MDTQTLIDSLPQYEMPDLANYSVEQFEQDIQNVQPRTFDTWVLPFFLAVYALKSGNKKMGKWPRRILFSAGIYMFYRNYSVYKESIDKIRGRLYAEKPGTV